MNNKLLLLIVLLNINIANGHFFLDIKKTSINRVLEDVFPVMKRVLNRVRHLPQQKVHGVKVTDITLQLDITSQPFVTLREESDDILITIKNVDAKATANMKVKLIKEMVEAASFHVVMSSIGFAMKLSQHEETKVFDTTVSLDHAEVNCDSIEIGFENETLNYGLQKVMNSSQNGIKNYICKLTGDLVKERSKTLGSHFLTRGLNERVNSFMPLDLPITIQNFLHIYQSSDIIIKVNSVIIPLANQIQSIDGTKFMKHCKEEDYIYTESFSSRDSDIKVIIPECYAGDFINTLANEEKGLTFPSIQHEINGKRIDIITIIQESEDHFIRSHNGYVNLVVDATLKVAYQGKMYYIESLAECNIRLLKLSGQAIDSPNAAQLEIRKYTFNDSVKYTDMNIGVFQAKMTLVNLKEYQLAENSPKLPDDISLIDIVDFYKQNFVTTEKKIRINRMCTTNNMCFDSWDFELMEGRVVLNVNQNDPKYSKINNN